MSEDGGEKQESNVIPLRKRNLQEKADAWRKPPPSLEQVRLEMQAQQELARAKETDEKRRESYESMLKALRASEADIIKNINVGISPKYSGMWILGNVDVPASADLRPSNAKLVGIVLHAMLALGIDGCAAALQKWLLEKPGRFHPRIVTVKVDPESIKGTRRMWLSWDEKGR